MHPESPLMPTNDGAESDPPDKAHRPWAPGDAEVEPDPGVPSQGELPVPLLRPTKMDQPGLPALPGTTAPRSTNPQDIKTWFDGLMDNAIPEPDGTLATARRTADTLARLAKSDNTRRAYRAGVRAWCDWCHKHDLPALPAAPADVAAFLSEQRYPAPPGKPLGVNTLKLRAASIRYLHYLARLPSPTSTADVGETLIGITRVARQAGQAPRPKLAARIAILREMTAGIGEDLPGLRDRALLLLGFAGAFRRAELARIELGHIEETEHGLRITLPVSKGDRAMLGVQVGIPYGTSELCPVRALRHWLQAAAISEGAIFRRVWATPRPPNPAPDWTPIHVVGTDAIDPGTVARIVKARGKAAGFDADLLSGHSLKRGAMNTAKDRRVHPTQLKQLGRHANYATLGAYLEEGDLFEDNALNGVL
jgi:integrase